MIDAVRRCLLRDLDTMVRELAAYPSDAAAWARVPGLPNVAGTLTLHCAGNLRHFIGAVLGQTGFVRDRDAEFARRDVPRTELTAELLQARADVDRTLRRLDTAQLGAPYPVPFAGVSLDTGTALIHLGTHLAYHLGQMDYHRRIVTGEEVGVDAVALPPLIDPTL